MQLTQAEIIQVLRRRANINQGDFGSQAFDTSFESGRTKVKNLELGKQKPTLDDLEKMARVLGVGLSEIRPSSEGGAPAPLKTADGTLIRSQTLGMFPGLAAYLDMLDKAVRIEDSELIGHIAGKIAAIFSGYPESGQLPAASRIGG
jgi:transcriptional regulator with XRE-family HTH domain